MKKIIVVGAGAGGMMAAITAAQKGAQVTLLEKNDRLGKKILISGKGRCNVTNNKDINQLINSFAHNGKFLYAAFNEFSNERVMDFFETNGVPLKVERGGRVFPVSDRSRDIVQALYQQLKLNHVIIKLNHVVSGLLHSEGEVHGVVLDSGEKLYADKVIIAVGGASYRLTGSSGDGYAWAKSVGHTIIPIRPSLVPLESPETWVRALQGLSLKNVSLILYTQNGKKIAADFGEMLFTHFGISGPIVLTLSGKAVDYWQKEKSPLTAEIDLKPALTVEQLDGRLLREVEQNHNKQLKNVMLNLLPQKLVPVFLEQVNLPEDRVMHQLTKDERQCLIKGLKHFSFLVDKPREINEAIVTAGGVNVKEISPKTMESKLSKNLYFAGEILDIDGITGGFNLQAAFSTGYLAGLNAAE